MGKTIGGKTIILFCKLHKLRYVGKIKVVLVKFNETSEMKQCLRRIVVRISGSIPINLKYFPQFIKIKSH